MLCYVGFYSTLYPHKNLAVLVGQISTVSLWYTRITNKFESTQSLGKSTIPNADKEL